MKIWSSMFARFFPTHALYNVHKRVQSDPSLSKRDRDRYADLGPYENGLNVFWIPA
jgi:hypothetical protein